MRETSVYMPEQAMVLIPVSSIGFCSSARSSRAGWCRASSRSTASGRRAPDRRCWTSRLAEDRGPVLPGGPGQADPIPSREGSDVQPRAPRFSAGRQRPALVGLAALHGQPVPAGSQLSLTPIRRRARDPQRLGADVRPVRRGHRVCAGIRRLCLADLSDILVAHCRRRPSCRGPPEAPATGSPEETVSQSLVL